MKIDTVQFVFLFIWMICVTIAVFPFSMFGCGPQWDATELERIRAVTCPSVCAAYADAVDAGVEITPEDEALIGGRECQF